MDELSSYLPERFRLDFLNPDNHKLLDFFWQHLWVEKNRSSHTIRAYLSDLFEFLLFLQQEELSITEVDLLVLRSYFTMRTGTDFRSRSQDQRQVTGRSQNRKLSARSQARKLSAVKSFFKLLHLHNKIKENPALAISTPRSFRTLPDPVRVGDMEKVLENQVENSDQRSSVKESLLKLRDQTINEMLYSSGMRISELLSLKLSDLDGECNQVKIVGKGNKERFVFLGEEARNWLKRYLQNRSRLKPRSERLFINYRGEPLNPRGVRHRMTQLAQKQQLNRKLHPHKFRHAFAVDLLNSGADIRGVQELLGHANLSTTQIYTRVTRERLQSIYRECHPHGKAE